MKIDFGKNLSICIQPHSLPKAEELFETILACEIVLKNSQYSVYRFPNGQIVGLEREEKALSEEEYEKTVWLEMTTTELKATVRRLRKFKIREVAGDMKDAFFFSVPGGPVVRLVESVN